MEYIHPLEKDWGDEFIPMETMGVDRSPQHEVGNLGMGFL